MHSQLIPWLVAIIAVLTVTVILLSWSGLAHNQLLKIRKRNACRHRQKIQHLFDEHREHIGFHIRCEVEGPIKLFSDWMTYKVMIPPTECDEDHRKPIRITIERDLVFRSARAVRVSITSPMGTITEKFYWTTSRIRSCDIAIRTHVLATMEAILSKIPSKENMAAMALMGSAPVE